ncbi:hypothetical protein RJ639_009802 [Escallonia herrerae]|uniref:DUF4219 domain-containing protein n=1 Tax=Escallonia herrerae TaxID=1293975 RepID=A0AA88VMD7_9ASTE|nr:hypothetical protein RJ639_010727 [Escallonia herrerae]KAK3013711.1 hypothetical protein RJ639_009802 [Escallonia herrerae]
MEVSNGGNVYNWMEKLVGKKYKYWRMCMEAYLQGQDLWELVVGTDAIPPDVLENAESRWKWKIKCGKAFFALRTSISKEFIDHVHDVCSPKEIWETLVRQFTKKNTARLQLLENELAMLKVVDKPSVKELENFLSNQEALAKQMAKSFETDDVHFLNGKSDKNLFRSKNKEEDSSAEKDRVVVTADNSTHPVAKEGVVTKNLVSVPQTTDSRKYVLFGPKDVKVLDNVKEISADVIFSGEKKGSLFVMSAGEAYVKKTCQTSNAAIWHARLGHIGYQLLQ